LTVIEYDKEMQMSGDATGIKVFFQELAKGKKNP
jgi:hypothetical protein